MPAIITCTVHDRCTSVLRTSIESYCPEAPLIINKVERSTFGESFNAAMASAFKDHDEIIIANDDIVLTPSSYRLLMEDVESLKAQYGDKLGIVAAHTDSAFPIQNIRFQNNGDIDRYRCKWSWENYIREESVVAPIFAWISKKAFETAQFPPLNWYSDDVICRDLGKVGFKHFVSRSYVHHVGSQTVGHDDGANGRDAEPWLRVYRPDYAEMWFGKKEYVSGLGLPSLLKRYTKPVGIEIGLNRGDTTRHLFNHVEGLTLKGVDPYPDYIDWDGTDLNRQDRDHAYDAFLKNTEPFTDRITHYRMLSDEAADKIENGSCDFVFIDGLHTYDQVLKDCQNYYPKIKDGGLFSGHDYTVIPEVKKAVDEFADSVGATILQTDHDVWYWFKPKKLKICVYAISKNEEQFVARWAQSAKDADLLLVADTGSTDGTVDACKANGISTHEICITPWRFDHARTASLALVPKDIDICVSLDLDEVLEPGWREEIERVWETNTTRLRYQYRWGEGVQFGYEKIHARHGYYWHHPCHEYPMPDGRAPEVWAHTDKLLVTHHPDPTKSRGQYLDLLALSVKEDPHCPRNAFYYARELSFNRRWDESIKELNRYLALPTATWNHERCYAMRTMATCYEGKGDQTQAETWWLRAAAEVPHTREPWCGLAQLYYAQSRWQECYGAAMRAVGIKNKELVYTISPEAWGAQPHDLAAIAAWNLGLKDDALEQGAIAVELAPDDQRLQENLLWFRGEKE